MRVCDLDPSALLLLPHGHHVVAVELEWLAVVASAHGHGVSDDRGVAAGLNGNIADGKIVNVGLFDLREGGVAIKRATGTDYDVAAGEVALNFGPIFFFRRAPPQPLELLDAGGVLP